MRLAVGDLSYNNGSSTPQEHTMAKKIDWYYHRKG
jgi:hypothetical protein